MILDIHVTSFVQMILQVLYGCISLLVAVPSSAHAYKNLPLHCATDGCEEGRKVPSRLPPRAPGAA